MSKRLLSDEQERELIARYRLYLQHRPKQLCREYGISTRRLYDYLVKSRSVAGGTHRGAGVFGG